MGPYSLGTYGMGETHSFLSPREALALLLCIQCCESCREEAIPPQFLGDQVSTRHGRQQGIGDPRLSGSSSLLQGRAGALPVSAEQYLDEGWSPGRR